MCSRQESNLHYQFRKLMSYPLNDESIIAEPTGEVPITSGNDESIIAEPTGEVPITSGVGVPIAIGGNTRKYEPKYTPKNKILSITKFIFRNFVISFVEGESRSERSPPWGISHINAISNF